MKIKGRLTIFAISSSLILFLIYIVLARDVTYKCYTQNSNSYFNIKVEQTALQRLFGVGEISAYPSSGIGINLGIQNYKNGEIDATNRITEPTYHNNDTGGIYTKSKRTIKSIQFDETTGHARVVCKVEFYSGNLHFPQHYDPDNPEIIRTRFYTNDIGYWESKLPSNHPNIFQ
jgi:hypothetical protein